MMPELCYLILLLVHSSVAELDVSGAPNGGVMTRQEQQPQPRNFGMPQQQSPGHFFKVSPEQDEDGLQQHQQGVANRTSFGEPRSLEPPAQRVLQQQPLPRLDNLWNSRQVHPDQQHPLGDTGLAPMRTVDTPFTSQVIRPLDSGSSSNNNIFLTPLRVSGEGRNLDELLFRTRSQSHPATNFLQGFPQPPQHQFVSKLGPWVPAADVVPQADNVRLGGRELSERELTEFIKQRSQSSAEEREARLMANELGTKAPLEVVNEKPTIETRVPLTTTATVAPDSKQQKLLSPEDLKHRRELEALIDQAMLQSGHAVRSSSMERQAKNEDIKREIVTTTRATTSPSPLPFPTLAPSTTATSSLPVAMVIEDKLKRLMSDKNGRSPSSQMHHKQFLVDLMKVLNKRVAPPTGSSSSSDTKVIDKDPVVRMLADKLRDQKDKIRGQVMEGVSAISDTDVTDGILQKLLFSGGAGSDGNRTRFINWKIINHGKQTIIIL